MAVEGTASRCTIAIDFWGDAKADATSMFGVRICERTSCGSVLVNDDGGEEDDSGVGDGDPCDGSDADDDETGSLPPSRFGNEFISNERGAIACAFACAPL